jgi:DNA-binding transcriptional ArsR family regulator
VESSLDRRARYELAHFGEAIGDPSRAAMLIALMGGAARPASELARVAGVAPSTATSHLQRLEAAGLVVVRAGGRHRYYSLSGPHVAEAVERIAVGAPNAGAQRRLEAHRDGLALARTCYGHLAGRLAVAFWARSKEARWVRWSDAAVTLLPRGRDVLARHGLIQQMETPRTGRPCLDWSERVAHVSGPLGVAVCDALLDRGWVARAGESRALRITTRGDERLRALGVRWRA